MIKRRKPRSPLATLPYPLYLLTAHWQRKRQAALARAGHRCQVCNTARQLEVHHRTYERLGAELAADLLVLCRACHQLFHARRVPKH